MVTYSLCRMLVEQNPEYLNRLKRDKMESMQLIQMCARLFPAAAVSGQYIFVGEFGVH